VKKAASRFLIFVFLSHIIGYYGIYAWLHGKANSNANTEIEAGTYDRTQTITLKIPLTMPYPMPNGFEPVHGDFELGGEFYKLVEQKYENDTLHIVCLRNDGEKKAAGVFSDLVHQSTNSTSTPFQNTRTFTGFLKDFFSTDALAMPVRKVLGVRKPFLVLNLPVLAQDYPVLTPPPNRHG
jgi:hypothetical protein